MLKHIGKIIAPVLVHICTSSLAKGTFPHALNTGEFVPLFKSGTPLRVNNDRPISLLSVFTKLLVKIA